MELVQDMTREQKIESLVPVAKSVAGYMSKGKTREQWEENLSYAYFGIVAAVDKFDPSRGASLATFAFDKARFEVVNGWRTHGIISRKNFAEIKAADEAGLPEPVVFKSEPLEADEVDRLTGAAHAKPTEDAAINGMACEQILTGLRPRLALVLRRRFLEEVPAQDVAEELGVHPSRISQLTNEALFAAKRLVAA